MKRIRKLKGLRYGRALVGGPRWEMNWHTNFTTRPRLPFEEAVKRMSWIHLSDTWNALWDLASSDDLTALELLKMVDSYLESHPREVQDRIHEETMAALYPRSRA